MRGLQRIARIVLTGLALGAAGAALGPPAGAQGAAVLHIRGGGDGHGIGLSQYGAYGFAQHGRDATWILHHYYTGTQLGRLTTEPTVRVLVGDHGTVAFSGATRASGVKLDATRSYTAAVLASGQMALTDSSGRPVARYNGAPLMVTGAGPLALAGIGTYRGHLELRPDGSGGIEAVDALNLEDYVRGVISAEMPSSWAPAALQAQAIAARTYAITTDAGGGVFDQYADTRSQMYQGVAAEVPSTDAAVAATRRLVVTYGGKPATTYFFNSSGGATENIENVWTGSPSQPWLKGVPDPYDGVAADPYTHWGRDLTASAAAARLGPLVKGSFVGIRVLRHGFSGRIVSAEVVGTAGTSQITGDHLRARFGLLTTLMHFTTISSRSVRASASAASGAAPAPGAFSALVPMVQSMVASVTPELTGRVYPGVAGAPLVVEQQAAGAGWRPVARTQLAAAGAFTVTPGRPGTFRVRYDGLTGPSVTLR